MQFSCFINHENYESVSKRCQQEYNDIHREAKNSKAQWFHNIVHLSLGCFRPVGRIIHFCEENKKVLSE